uniref:Uncharacterized protein n=1 Tax=Molossus molossus TaxID=27622 RepID=A0A7J8JVD8_MOLMO|nr:hypothetical protein HJG59_007909 [Molossus molossus]
MQAVWMRCGRRRWSGPATAAGGRYEGSSFNVLSSRVRCPGQPLCLPQKPAAPAGPLLLVRGRVSKQNKNCHGVQSGQDLKHSYDLPSCPLRSSPLLFQAPRARGMNLGGIAPRAGSPSRTAGGSGCGYSTQSSMMAGVLSSGAWPLSSPKSLPE